MPQLSLTELATAGGGSYLLSSLLSFVANAQEMSHEKFLKSLQYAVGVNEQEFKDVADARKAKGFTFARRAIVLSLFPGVLLLLFLVGYLGIPVSIPTVQQHSYLFGLVKTTKTVIESTNGFYLLEEPIAFSMISIVGLYFGAKNRRTP